MKNVKKRFVSSLLAIVVVLAIAALMAHSGAVGNKAVAESMKPYIKTGITAELAVGVLVYALWFAGYNKRLARAINPGTEPSHKFLWGIAAAIAAIIPCMLFMVLKGVPFGVTVYGLVYAVFTGISTAAAAAYTEF